MVIDSTGKRVQGYVKVLKLCNETKVRLLFASTCCCYGNNNTHPTNEDSPTCPTEPYAKSKKASEKDILETLYPCNHSFLCSQALCLDFSVQNPINCDGR